MFFFFSFFFYFRQPLYPAGISVKSNPNSVEKINFRFSPHFILSWQCSPPVSISQTMAARLFYFEIFLSFDRRPKYYTTTPATRRECHRRVVWDRSQPREHRKLRFLAEKISFPSFLPNGSRLMQYLPIFPAAARNCARN